MSSIQNPSVAVASPQQQNALSDAQFSNYTRKQSMSVHESLNAGLTIKTKEGDLVTLTSNSYAQFDAFQYNSKGVLNTDTGRAMVSQNHREVSLATGENFSFSVVGELSEEELLDIEAIVTGIDSIISEMEEGDMNGAIDKALSMGGYDSVSMYSADITHKKSYEMVSETSAQQIETKPYGSDPSWTRPASYAGKKTDYDTGYPSFSNMFSESLNPPKNEDSFLKNVDSLMEKMINELEKHEEKMVEKAQSPLDKLFDHHKRNAMNHEGEETTAYKDIENIQKKMELIIEEMAGNMFENYFSELTV